MATARQTPASVWLSWSGGKDSAMALRALHDDPSVQVKGLLTTVTDAYDRISVHGVRRSLLAAQGEALGLPVHTVHLQPQSSNEAYEQAMHDGLAEARARDIEEVAFGDLFLADIRAYREALLAKGQLGIRFPIWGHETGPLLTDAIAWGLRATVCVIDTEQLDPGFLGRRIDPSFLEDLPDGVDPCGENGEFHTFVHDAPLFARPVPVRIGERREDGRFHFIDLLPA